MNRGERAHFHTLVSQRCADQEVLDVLKRRFTKQICPSKVDAEAGSSSFTMRPGHVKEAAVTVRANIACDPSPRWRIRSLMSRWREMMMHRSKIDDRHYTSAPPSLSITCCKLGLSRRHEFRSSSSQKPLSKQTPQHKRMQALEDVVLSCSFCGHHKNLSDATLPSYKTMW